MRKFALPLAVAALCAFGPGALAAEKNKRLLLVTHSGGFVHGSVATAEEVLKEVGPKNGFDVTCWRFTGDPDAKVKKLPKGLTEARNKLAQLEKNKVGGSELEDALKKVAELEKGIKDGTVLEQYSEKFRGPTGLPVEKEHCGRINKETLKNFDAVLFFTTGDPLTKEELADLRDWIRAGGAFAGTHCASDTLYNGWVSDGPNGEKKLSYGELLGGYFKTHPSGLQDIKVKVEDPKHPAAAGFTDGMAYKDEMYIFRDAPYSRDRLHIILSIGEWTNIKLDGGQARKDEDYAISWCREEGKGKIFYTSFGHDPKVWKDEKFQAHLFGGLKWATGELKGDATPSGAKK